jgi:hypothetical protein
VTDPELVEIPCPHLRPGDPSVRVNLVTTSADGRGRHFRLAFCEACARGMVAGLSAEIGNTFSPGRWNG